MNTMPGFARLASTTVKAPYHRPGGVVEYISVPFDVYQKEHRFKAVPACCKTDRRLTHLPPVLSFQIKNNRLYIFRDEHKDLVKDLVKELIQNGKIMADIAHLPVVSKRRNG